MTLTPEDVRRSRRPDSRGRHTAGSTHHKAGATRSHRETERGPTAAVSPTRRGSLTVLVVLVCLLNLTGLVMVLSASSVESLRHYGTPWHYFIRQLMWLATGVVAFAVAFRVDHQRWRKLAPLAMGTTLLLLVAVLVPGVGVRASGASRWLGTASLQIQPSEIAKLTLVIFAADLMDRRAGRGDWRYQLVPVLCVVLALAVLIMKQPDMGTTTVLVCIALAMVFTAGMPWRPLGAVLGLGAGAGLA
ncbi:MAG: FtsW/RodA/SpoVE family cell cycle protein, partial [Actinomycetota bacterium]|nr:FtsW/RodA/SpoVE family cell cycle protein [Actinomycetota bacterium]